MMIFTAKESVSMNKMRYYFHQVQLKVFMFFWIDVSFVKLFVDRIDLLTLVPLCYLGSHTIQFRYESNYHSFTIDFLQFRLFPGSSPTLAKNESDPQRQV